MPPIRDWHGEALWPAMYPEAQLRIIKRAVGRYVYSAQYQQTPTPAEGGIFRRADFRYCRRLAGVGYELLDENMQRAQVIGDAWLYRFATVDPALSEKETADYTVLALWGVTPHRDLLLLDLVREHFEQPDVRGLILRSRAGWDITDMRVEAKADGLALFQGVIRAGEPG